MTMILQLATLPMTLKGPKDKSYKGQVPTSMRFLHPEAAESIMQIEGDGPGLIYTDIYRNAMMQLAANRAKPGITKAVGFSPHNYGLAVDIDVDATMDLHKTNYAKLSAMLESYGWFCHRRDGQLGSESWHFNFLGCDGRYVPRGTWGQAIEEKIKDLYGKYFVCNVPDVLTFQRAWGLDPDGIAGPKTQRTYAYVNSIKNVV